MDPLDWAKQCKQAAITRQFYRRGPNIRQTEELDDNELGKYIATLRQQGSQQLRQVADGLACQNTNQEPMVAFGRRSGNEYLGRFKVLQKHIVHQLPPNWDDEDTTRGLRWLKRLLDIEDSDRKQRRQGQDKLLHWLLHDERATVSTQTAPSSARSSSLPRHEQDRQGRRHKKKKGKR